MASQKSLVQHCRKQFPTQTPVLSLGSILENANFHEVFLSEKKDYVSRIQKFSKSDEACRVSKMPATNNQ